MRSMNLLLGGFLALVITACSGAEAAQAQPEAVTANAAATQTQAAVDHSPAKFIQRFDKNGDGKVQVSELPEKMQAHLAKADTNNDGVLSTEELQANAALMHQKRFERMDKNGDGAVEQGEVSDKMWTRIAVADANKDGKITREELRDARAAGKLPKFEGHRHQGGRGNDQKPSTGDAQQPPVNAADAVAK